MASTPSKRRRKRSKIPEVNLIPMMDVLMVMLSYFVIISMVLTAEKGVDIALTGGKNQPPAASQEQLPDPMIVELSPPLQIIVNKRVVNRDQLPGEIKAYLDANPKGAVLLSADRNLEYQKVVDLLGQMQSIGGSRVSLGLEGLGTTDASAPATSGQPVAEGASPTADAQAPAAEAPSATQAPAAAEVPSATQAAPAPRAATTVPTAGRPSENE
jgi:biopolymer transport protein ExbD